MAQNGILAQINNIQPNADYSANLSDVHALRDSQGNLVNLGQGFTSTNGRRINPDNIDGMKVAIARQEGISDGLNADELEAYSSSYDALVAKYGINTANAVSNKITDGTGAVASNEMADRSALQIAGDTANGVLTGAAQGILGGAQLAAQINPLTRIADLFTESGHGATDTFTNSIAGLSKLVQDASDAMVSDSVAGNRQIRAYKNQLSEAQHAREEQEAIARGESSLVAGLARFGKDIVSGVANSTDNLTGLFDSGSNLVGSVMSGGAISAGAKLGAKAIGGALARAGALSQATAKALPSKIGGQMTVVGAQEGGSAGNDAINAVNEMSDEELTNASAQYREAKAKYLAEGHSEPEAEELAKADVASSAGTRASLLTGLMAAPLGRIADNSTITKTIGQFKNVTPTKVAREAAEEGLENLGQIGNNYAAKTTYDNDRDMLDGVGTAVGEGMASAGFGAGVAGSPSLAKAGVKKALEHYSKEDERYVQNKHVKNIQQNIPAIDEAITAINQEKPEEEAKVDKELNQLDGNVVDKQTATEALNKVKNIGAQIESDEEAANISDTFGAPNLAKKGDTKLDVLNRVGNYLNGALNKISEGTEPSDVNKLMLLSQVGEFNRLRNELFQEQPIENIVKHIEDEGLRKKVQTQLSSYEKLSSNPKWEELSFKANKFASDIIKANNDITDAFNDRDLSDEEAVAKIDTVIAAYKQAVRNHFATEEDLVKAKELLEKKGVDFSSDDAVFFDEIDEEMQSFEKEKQLQENEQKYIEGLAKRLGISTQDVIDFRNGAPKGIQTVAREKLEALYDGKTTNRKSYESISREIRDLFFEGKVKQAHQALTDYANFTQSQINKLNAWKKSKEQAIQAFNETGKKQQAPVVTYSTYNPQERSWHQAKGVYAGRLELGDELAYEASQLVEKFNFLKDTYFKNSNLKIENYDPNSGLVNDAFIHNERRKVEDNLANKPAQQMQSVTPTNQAPKGALEQLMDLAKQGDTEAFQKALQEYNQNQSQAKSEDFFGSVDEELGSEEDSASSENNNNSDNFFDAVDESLGDTNDEEISNNNSDNSTGSTVGNDASSKAGSTTGSKSELSAVPSDRSDNSADSNDNRDSVDSDKDAETKAQKKTTRESKPVEDETKSLEDKVTPTKSHIQRIREKLFKFKNDKVPDAKSIQESLAGKEHGLNAHDAKVLRAAFNPNNSNSQYNQFKEAIWRAFSSEDGGIIKKNASVPFIVSNSSVFKNEVAKQGKITFNEAMSVLTNPELMDKVSDSEMSWLMGMFPILAYMDIHKDENGKVVNELNDDAISKAFITSIGYLNKNKNGMGLTPSRIAEFAGIDLSDLLVNYHDETTGENNGAKYIDLMSKGIALSTFVDALDRNLTRTLGIKADKTVGINAKQNIARVLAVAAIQTLANEGVIEVHNVEGVLNSPTIITVPKEKAITNDLQEPELLDKLLQNEDMNDNGVIYTDGSEPEDMEIRSTYLHTNEQIPQKGIEAVKEYSKVPYRVDEGMLHIYNELGKDGLLALYGQEITAPVEINGVMYDTMDLEDKISKEGKNLEIVSAFEKVQDWTGKMQEFAKEAGVPLSKVKKRFALGLTKVNRIQELESFGPIANKLTREVLLSTWNTIDLNNEVHRQEFARAVIQNFGGKLNATNFNDTYAAFDDLVAEISANPDAFENLLKLSDSSNKIDVETINKAHEELAEFMSIEGNPCDVIGLNGCDKNFMGLHAMQSLARYVQALKNKESSFETSIYCEADGTTNGTINSQFLFTSNITQLINDSGLLEADYGARTIELCDMGNMRLGDHSGKPAGEIKAPLKGKDRDVYGRVGGIAQQNIQANIATLENEGNWVYKGTYKEGGAKRYKDVTNKDPKRPNPKQFVSAVTALFQFSGLSKNADTAFQDNITRNLEKKPCTKGMYGAGRGSIVNSYVDEFITDLHDKRTKVMRARVQALKDGKPFGKLETAKAMFADIEKAKDKEWKDKDYIHALEYYLGALNTLNRFSLNPYENLWENNKVVGSGISVNPRYAFTDTNNTYRDAEDHIQHKIFTYESFFPENLVSQNNAPFTATVRLDKNGMESIVDGIAKVYGDTNYQTIQNTIRGENVAPTQRALLGISSFAGFLANMFRLPRIAEVDPNTTSVQEVNRLVEDFSDSRNPFNNTLKLDGSSLALTPTERTSKEIMAGGSIKNAKTFTKFSADSNSVFQGLGSDHLFDTNFQVSGNPGVGILPTMTIDCGDGMMMQTAMRELLKQINYATTLIFDGGNAAVGMMKKYGKEINKIQYYTDLKNVLIPVYQKAKEMQTYLNNNPTYKAELEKSAKLIAEAVNLESKDQTNFAIDSFIQLVSTYDSLNGNSGARNHAIRDFIREKNELIRNSKSKDAYKRVCYTTKDFAYNEASATNLRMKVKQSVFMQLEYKFGAKFTKAVADAKQKAAKNDPTVLNDRYRIPPEVIKQFFPEAESGTKKILELYHNELTDCLSMFGGDYVYNEDKDYTEYIPRMGQSSEDFADTIEGMVRNIANHVTAELRSVSKNISYIQAAKYLMGGTYDHMASHDSPFVAIPTKEELPEILKSLELTPKDGESIDSIWKALMEDENAPFQKLIDMQGKNTADFLKRHEERADILRGFVSGLEKLTEYTPKLADGNKASEEVYKEPKGVRTTTVKQFITDTKGKNPLANILSAYYDNLGSDHKGIKRDTKIVFITGKSPSEVLQKLEDKYRHDKSRTGSEVAVDDAVISRIAQHKNNYISEVQQFTGKEKGSVSASDAVNLTKAMQLFVPRTNTIYVPLTNHTGVLSQEEEAKYINTYIPHEILHSLSVDAVDYYAKFMDGDLSHFKPRQKIIIRSLKRIRALKQEVDSLLPTLETLSGVEEARSLHYYLRNKDKWGETEALKEFIAVFGALSEAELNTVNEGIKNTPHAETILKEIAWGTSKDIKKLSNILQAVKKAFTEFISALFGISTSSSLVKDIVNANTLMINAAWREPRTKPAEVMPATKEVSFFDEIEEGEDDTRVSVDSGVYSSGVEFVGTPVTRTKVLNQLSNAVSKAMKQRLQEWRNDDISVENRILHNKEVLLSQNRLADNGEAIPSLVIKPLKDFGFNVGNEQAFCNVVNMLGFMHDIKVPIYSDVATSVAKVIDKLNIEDFCDNPADDAERIAADSVVKFLRGSDVPTELVVPMIFALSQSDPKFREILSKMETEKTKDTTDYLNLDKQFVNMGEKLLNVFTNITHRKRSKNVEQYLDRMADKMLRDEHDYNKNLAAEKAVDRVENYINSKLGQGINKVTGTKFGTEDAAVAEAVRDGENRFNNIKKVPHFAKELVHDVIGRTKDSHEFQRAVTKAKTTVQQDRQEAIDKLPLITKQRFKTRPTKEQWARFTRTIGKSGIAALYDGDIRTLARILTSPESLKAEIEKHKATIGDSYRINKCKQLANYMMTGEAGSMLLRNPIAIAKALGSKQIKKPTDAEIKACDKLTSLYALQKLTKEERQEIAKLIHNDESATEILLNTVQGQQNEGYEKVKGTSAENNCYKASLPTAFKDAKRLKVAPIADRKDMERMGYKFVRPYIGSNLDDAKLAVYSIGFNKQNSLNPGGLQFTGMTANGINVHSGASLKPNGGLITDYKKVQKIVKNLGNESAHKGEELLPLFDENGDIYAFERSISPELLNDPKYLTPKTDFADLLGIQAGRNKEEQTVASFNAGIVDILHDQYDKAMPSQKRNYVNLFEEKDPVIANVVKMMPKELRGYIESKFGKGQFMVLRSEVNDVIGYHSASITDSWTGESRLPQKVQDEVVRLAETVFGKKAFEYLKRAENFEHNVVVSAKNLIIIRSVVVPVWNFCANIIQLLNEGVPMATIANHLPRVIKELEQYTKFRTELLKIEQELAGSIGGRKDRLEAQKRMLEDAIHGLSIGYLVEQKEFSSIADLGNNDRDIDLSEGNIGDQIVAKIDELSDNTALKTLTHYGTVAPDTSLYKLLEKANQYGDFIGKAIYFIDLTERKGLSKEEAHLRVADEFVDYVRLPGRGRDFMERTGLVWFGNYKLRMMKVAARNLKEHPLRTLALTGMGLPTPLSDSLFGKLGVIGYSLGPAMLISAFGMNPWIALLGLLF